MDLLRAGLDSGAKRKLFLTSIRGRQLEGKSSTSKNFKEMEVFLLFRYLPVFDPLIILTDHSNALLDGIS